MPQKYKNMTDEELDRLFKDAADNFKNSNPPEKAWEAFYARNEKHLKENGDEEYSAPLIPVKPAPWVILLRKYRVAAAVFLLAVAATFLWVDSSRQPRRNTAGLPPVSAAKDAGITAPDATQQKLAGEKEDSSLPETQRTAGTLAAPAPVTPALGEQPGLLTRVPPNPLPQTDPPVQPSTDMAAAPSKDMIPHMPSQGDKKRMDLAAGTTEKTPKNTTVPGINYFAVAKTPAKATKAGKWQMGIVGGTNIAMVKGDVSSTPGLNTGILVQRRINDSRVSLESGVIYESMTYAVENEYFNPGGQPVSAKVSNISGSCTMIDVPVNVRYDMVHAKKSKAFVSTGVSPTVMVKQSYVYDYTDENGTRLIDRDVTGQGKSFYAVANLSVGYEQKWNKTSVQVAPYLKIPMGEIGYGNLSLGGIGTQVSIKRDL